MGKFDIISHSAEKITLRFKQTADEKLAQNWKKVKPDIPLEQGDSTTYLNKLNGFWDSVKQKNPLWIPFSLGTGDVKEIQAEVDRLTRKARKRESFTDTEKEFLKSLYGWIAWGGLAKWYPEASHLLRHYLNGNGSPLQIDAYVYRSSVIVKYAVGEIKKVIVADIQKSGTIRNGGTLASPGLLKNTPRSFAVQCSQGAIVDNGYLMAEQNNKRLKNADNRFPLISISMILMKSPIRVKTDWQIESKWDYESFENQRKRNLNLVTELPLPGGSKLQLPDGLSQYLEVLNIARSYKYTAEWTEEWSA
jgi:hypothetical protein